MPRIHVSAPRDGAAGKFPREFALFQAMNTDGLDEQALAKYADAGVVKELAGKSSPVAFEDFAQAVKMPSQAQDAEGDGNTLGWAARDKTGTLAPLMFNRRELGDLDVFLQIAYAGVCHSDLHTIRAEWGQPKYPVVPGHEIVGFVAEVGPKVTKFKVGDRAGVGVFVDSCKECRQCKGKDERYCPKLVQTYNSMHYDGIQAQGGYSTHIISNEDYTLHVPDNLDLTRVAPLLCAGITVYTPLVEQGLNKPGKKVGVVGLGGLGHMAVKLAAAMGAEVTVLSRSKAKEAEALAMGAKHLLVSSDEESLKQAEKTFDGIIDTVSAKHDLNAELRLLAPHGKLVVVGLPPAPVEIDHRLLITSGRSLAGSMIGNLATTQEMLNFCGEHNVMCDVEVITMAYINEAMHRLEEGDVRFRFVIDINKSLAL